jgi:hypothetical protein
MTGAKKSSLVIVIGALMFVGFGFWGPGQLGIAGWVIAMLGMGWYGYDWFKRNRRSRP